MDTIPRTRHTWKNVRRARGLGRASGEACLEGAHEVLVHSHHGPGVVELSAIVGRTKDGDELPLAEELVAVLNDLVRAHLQGESTVAQCRGLSAPQRTGWLLAQRGGATAGG